MRRLKNERPALAGGLLAVVLLSVAGLTALVILARQDASALHIAKGATHGSFHPVAGDFRADATEIEDCADEDTGCLQQAFGNVAFHHGPDAALEQFDEAIAADTAIRSRCHPIVHAIGSATLARERGNVARAFSQGSPSCASGYYHGLLERAFVGASTKGELTGRARSLCRGLRKRGFLAYQCVHGLGHGLMIQTGYDLPIALEMCDRLATGWDRTSCRGGVFMENTSTDLGFRSRWLKEDDLVYPCNAVDRRYRRSCYLRVTSRILEANDHDWDEAATLCANVGDPWKRFCFRSYGRDASGFAQHDPAKVLELCTRAEPADGECLYGAARTIADTYADAEPAAELCERAPEHTRDSCFTGLGLVVGLLKSTDRARQETCARLAASHTPACVSGARAEVASGGHGAWG